VRVLKRDPFARDTLCKANYSNSLGRETCAWCGQNPTTLYRYAWVNDADAHVWRRIEASLRYCSVSCYRAFTDDTR